VRRLLLLLIPLALLGAAEPAAAAPRTVWLCKPGLERNPCSTSLRTTVFSPSGERLRVQRPRRVRRSGIDCFYVYPTVSDQPATIANRRIDPVQRSVALYQAARFSQYCRVFAPMYRQSTLAGLFSGGGGLVNPKGYADVLRAWRRYLRRHNRGRGIVLIGHSQGAYMLRRLIAREIDRRRSVRRRLVSAILLGGNVEVRRGRGVEGDFKRIRACRSRRQLGCVVAFSTFHEPVPTSALFGRTGRRGREVLCTNPTALGGGSGLADVHFPSKPFAPGGIAAGITAMGVTLPTASTTWIAGPNAYRARCSRAGGINVLIVTPRRGAPVFRASPSEDFGLHLADANLALGNLVRLVGRQAGEYRRRR
jgi:hypothetical protein